MVLIMSVHPGFGGQTFIPETLNKVRAVRTMINDGRHTDIRLEVDGGIHVDNIAQVGAAGADTFVMGSAIFNAPDYAAQIKLARERLKAAC